MTARLRHKQQLGFVTRTISLPKQVDEALIKFAAERAIRNMEVMNVSATLKEIILERLERVAKPVNVG